MNRSPTLLAYATRIAAHDGAPMPGIVRRRSGAIGGVAELIVQ